MTATLDMLETSYPEMDSPWATACTMSGSAAYDVCWAVSEPFWEIVVDDRLAANPINHVDPSGLKGAVTVSYAGGTWTIAGGGFEGKFSKKGGSIKYTGEVKAFNWMEKYLGYNPDTKLAFNLELEPSAAKVATKFSPVIAHVSNFKMFYFPPGLDAEYGVQIGDAIKLEQSVGYREYGYAYDVKYKTKGQIGYDMVISGCAVLRATGVIEVEHTDHENRLKQLRAKAVVAGAVLAVVFAGPEFAAAAAAWESWEALAGLGAAAYKAMTAGGPVPI
jgi:hypothetical protein